MGSLANSTSKPGLSEDILLVNIPIPPNEEWIAKIEATYPGLKVRWSQRHPLLTKDKGIPPELWDGVTIVVCSATPPAHLMSKVRYVQLSSAGADRWLEHEVYKDKNVVFCTANGCHPYVMISLKRSGRKFAITAPC